MNDNLLSDVNTIELLKIRGDNIVQTFSDHGLYISYIITLDCHLILLNERNIMLGHCSDELDENGNVSHVWKSIKVNHRSLMNRSHNENYISFVPKLLRTHISYIKTDYNLI